MYPKIINFRMVSLLCVLCFASHIKPVVANSHSLIFNLDEYETFNYESHDYPWANNRLGLDEIAPPWTALKYDSNRQTVLALNKVLTFDSLGMLEAISVDGTDLLYAPTELDIVIDGKSVVTALESFEITSLSNRVLTLKSKTITQEYELELTSVVEYDGFTMHTIRILPSDSISIDLVSLSMSIDKIAAGSISRYLSYDYVSQRFDRSSIADVVSDSRKPVFLDFSPSISIESSEYGIEWLAQTNHNYSPIRSEKTHSILPTDEGVQFTTSMVKEPQIITGAIEYQFAIMPLPSRPASSIKQDEFIASAKSTAIAGKRFGKFCCLKPTYFAHWGRLDFATVGLPQLSNEDRSKPEADEVKQLIDDDRIRVMPYTATHLLSAVIPELKEFGSLWNSADARRGSWPQKTGISGDSMQPVSFDHKSLADFMLAKFSDAFNEVNFDSMFHDVVGMHRTTLTAQRVIDESQIANGVVFFPFYGLRKYLQRSRVLIKNVNADSEIVFHTGALLPKSLSTYADKVVFGESLHFSLKELKTSLSVENTEYQPDYFSLPEILFSGPFSQKNGFLYHIIPQLQRKDVSELSEKDLAFWTRRLIAFSHLHGYPLWSTKLRTKEHLDYLRIIDLFGGLHDTIKTVETVLVNASSTESNELIFVTHRRKNSSLMMVINAGEEEVELSSYIDAKGFSPLGKRKKSPSLLAAGDYRLFGGD